MKNALYYLPQYLPVYNELQKENVFDSKFIFHHGKFDDLIKKIIKDECLPANWVQDKNHALKFYLTEKPNWIFLGNTFPELNKIHIYSKTAQLGHGVGPKKSYYSNQIPLQQLDLLKVIIALRDYAKCIQKIIFKMLVFVKWIQSLMVKKTGLILQNLDLITIKKQFCMLQLFIQVV